MFIGLAIAGMIITRANIGYEVRVDFNKPTEAYTDVHLETQDGFKFQNNSTKMDVKAPPGLTHLFLSVFPAKGNHTYHLFAQTVDQYGHKSKKVWGTASVKE